jgi:hypothetical protein
VAVIIPAMRPHRLAPVVQSIQKSTSDYRIIIVATGECAEVARTLPVTIIDDGGGTWPVRINRGVDESTEQFVMTGADDIAFMPGWFESAMIAMHQLPDGSGVIALNDGYNMAGVHFVVNRSYIEKFGVIDEPGKLACESYVHSHVDDEIRSTAKFHERWSFCHDARIEHLHVGRGMAPMDEVYAMGERSMQQGRDIFLSRAHLWSTN